MQIIALSVLAGLSGLLGWSLWKGMTHALQMLQQCHYMNDRFGTWMKNNQLTVFPFPLAILTGLQWGMFGVTFFISVPASLLAIGSFLILVLSLGMVKISRGTSKELKKPLKKTARVWRLIATGTL